MILAIIALVAPLMLAAAIFSVIAADGEVTGAVRIFGIIVGCLVLVAACVVSMAWGASRLQAIDKPQDTTQVERP